MTLFSARSVVALLLVVEGCFAIQTSTPRSTAAAHFSSLSPRRFFLGSFGTAAAAAAAAATAGAGPAQAVATNANYGNSAKFAVIGDAPKSSGPSVYDSAIGGSLGDAKREKAISVLKAEVGKIDALERLIGKSAFENDIGISASKVLPALKTLNPDSPRYAAVKAAAGAATFASQKNRLDKAKSELEGFGGELKAFLKEQGVDVTEAPAPAPAPAQAPAAAV